ncbi:MAG: hypothetical protein UV50_C0008G0042 [Parcubacteria group bacterium GW2011_GWB1_42_9]|nr:MAG: hypothetical protein UV50_C0008G0042 [Parcubacteria group bacterium GW2011_GWB1_42_9]
MDWRSNNRFDYLSGFILDDEKIISWPEMEKIINSIGKKDLQAMACKIFDKSQANLIIYGQKPELDLEEIEGFLKF